MARKYDVDMPIIFAVNDIVNNGMKPLDAVNSLLNRERKTEIDSAR